MVDVAPHFIRGSVGGISINVLNDPATAIEC